ncbi:MAG: hypothetical protein ACXU95_13550 [Isosphaeraceae bacterium]
MTRWVELSAAMPVEGDLRKESRLCRIARGQWFLFGMGNAMKVAEIVRADGAQLVKLPEGFQLEGDIVSIRRQGKAIVLEPVKPATWPPGFFEQIHIDDPAFARPPQGQVPPAPRLD